RWDREQRVRAARASGDYDRLLQRGHALMCRRLTATGCQTRDPDGAWGRRRWADLAVPERRRLLEVAGSAEVVGPVMLWVAEGGSAATVKSWQTIFRRA